MAGRGSRYVKLEKPDFEAWLRSSFSGYQWSIKGRTKGVYILHLSENVGLAINSTLGEEEGKDIGRASMGLRLVSIHPEKSGQTIWGQKKIMSQIVRKKFLARTTNWKKNWAAAVHLVIAHYEKTKDFVEEIALPSPTAQEQLEMIESIPNWERNKWLSSFHGQLLGNRNSRSPRSLSPKQWEILQDIKEKGQPFPPQRQPQRQPPPEPEAQPEPPQQQADPLDQLRQLYIDLRSAGASTDDLEEVAEIGQGFKKQRRLNEVDSATLKEIAEENGLSLNRYAPLFGGRGRFASWKMVALGDNLFEVYHRGIPSGSVRKIVKAGVSQFEAHFSNQGKELVLGAFRKPEQAFAAIQKKRGS